MPQTYIFSGESREILIQSGTSEVDVQILYSNWKEWVKEGVNAKWLPAFRTIGGDTTASGQFAPRYYFLINSWLIVVNGDLTPSVDFSLNLYSDAGGSPFTIINGANVSNLRSDVAVVEVGAVTETNISDIVDGVTGATSADTQTILINTAEILGLVQSNFVMTDQIYNTNDDLLTATVKTYPTAADLSGDTNMIASYSVVATYAGTLLSSYKVTKQ